MALVCSKHYVGHGQFAGRLAAVGVAAMLAFAGMACTSASIESSGGAGGNGQGGAGGGGGAGTNGGGGVVIIPTSIVSSSGGTTGLVCNSTSTAGCKAQAPEGCGDGINNQGGIEECDDGNVLPGDGCNGNCKVEPNWTCPKAGPCTRKIICGDSVIGAGEVCDDGNTKDGDG